MRKIRIARTLPVTSVDSLKRWLDNLRFAIACVFDCEPTFMDELLKRGRDAPPLKYHILKRNYRSNQAMQRLSEICYNNGFIAHMGDDGTLEYIPKDGQYSLFDDEKKTYLEGIVGASYV